MPVKKIHYDHCVKTALIKRMLEVMKEQFDGAREGLILQRFNNSDLRVIAEFVVSFDKSDTSIDKEWGIEQENEDE